VWLAFLAYVVVIGGRAVRAGETGAVTGAGQAARAPVSA
jgi:hypothetical protein